MLDASNITSTCMVTTVTYMLTYRGWKEGQVECL